MNLPLTTASILCGDYTLQTGSQPSIQETDQMKRFLILVSLAALPFAIERFMALIHLIVLAILAQ